MGQQRYLTATEGFKDHRPPLLASPVSTCEMRGRRRHIARGACSCGPGTMCASNGGEDTGNGGCGAGARITKMLKSAFTFFRRPAKSELRGRLLSLVMLLVKTVKSARVVSRDDSSGEAGCNLLARCHLLVRDWLLDAAGKRLEIRGIGLSSR